MHGRKNIKLIEMVVQESRRALFWDFSREVFGETEEIHNKCQLVLPVSVRIPKHATSSMRTTGHDDYNWWEILHSVQGHNAILSTRSGFQLYRLRFLAMILNRFPQMLRKYLKWEHDGFLSHDLKFVTIEST